jgi:hypothetical protein
MRILNRLQQHRKKDASTDVLNCCGCTNRHSIEAALDERNLVKCSTVFTFLRSFHEVQREFENLIPGRTPKLQQAKTVLNFYS